MEIRELRALLAVVRTGSFGRAATELGYTQSAVSQQIAALEHELGTSLFERRPVRPTAAGLRLAEHASRIVLRLDAAESEFRRRAPEPLVLRIVATALGADAALAAALRELRAATPGIDVSVATISRDEAAEALATGAADLAIVDGYIAAENPLAIGDAGLFSSFALAHEPLVVAIAVAHPLARRRQLELRSLVDAPVIDAVGLSHDALRLIDRRDGGARVSLRYTGTNPATLLELVAAGHGYAILPEPRCVHPGVIGVPLVDPRLVQRVEAVTLRSRTPVVSRLVGLLRARSTLA